MSSVLVLDDIIMNISTESTKKSMKPHQKLFFPESRKIQFTCTENLCRIYMEKKKCRYKKDTTFASFHWNWKIEKISFWYLIYKNDKADLDKKTNHFINDRSNFNNTHIIKFNIQPVSNITEEEHFISSMILIGFRNDQDASRCYANSSLQVLFFNIFFRKLIMNIDCEILFTNLDNSTDDYNDI